MKTKFIKVCTSDRCAKDVLKGVKKNVSDWTYTCPDCKSVLLTKKEGQRKNNCAEVSKERRP